MAQEIQHGGKQRPPGPGDGRNSVRIWRRTLPERNPGGPDGTGPRCQGDSRWPEYLATAFEHGVRSILAVPFQLDQEEAKAALNLYAAKEDAFSAETIDTAESYVHIAAGSLQLAVRIARLSDARQNLMAAMESRTAIDTAVGVIMAQNRCSQEAAFATLKRASSSRNMKLRDIAVSVLASVAQDPSVATHFES